MTQQTATSRRIIAQLSNGIVLSTAVAATIPILILSLILLNDDSIGVEIFLAPIIAFIGGAAFGIYVYNLSFRKLEQTLGEYIMALDKVAEGDLTQRLSIPDMNVESVDGRIMTHLGEVVNRTLDQLHGIVQEINRAMERLEKDTEAILDATSRQITMANEQDAVVTETTATVNEVRATVTETAERAQSVAETAQTSVDISRSGSEAVDETVAGMEIIRRRVEDIADNILVLSEHTQQIGEIIATVNNLADQSRMLALNASVEAARAGEEGKGFAVVAMEVRNLADQNRDATVQVREILGEIQRSTNSAVMVTEEGSKGVDSGQQQVNG